ncbi:hypothetical protein [Candidatus Halobonum tyrrellensis]|uniref:Cell surface protein n=1 Tax=Candidatus Halobonum tyrrellensis G22 TaxID=1324957 RepID=V4IUS7_9EURY|nr:hypothetical protein [Candidatus Halobonum tyrrellensis]ESP86952.1 cell surface protein [Candidatus Halobonum tyrrellensis G22]
MTRYDPISVLATLAADRPRGVALGLTALALLGGVTAAGTVAAQSDAPTVRVGGATVAPDGTVTVGVVLTDAPDGLSGYYLDLSVSDPETAHIDSAGYPDAFGLTTDPAIADDGASVTLEAADVEGAVEPRASNVTLATVELAGVAPGETELVVEPRQFDADDGSALDPATRAGVVTVTGGDTAGSAGAGTTDTAAAAAASTATADAAESAGNPGGDTTATAAPLPAVLAFVAVGLLAALALVRRP